MKAPRFLVILVVFLALPLAAFAFDLTAGIIGGAAFPYYSGSDFQAALDSLGYKTEFRFGISGGGFFTIGIIDLLAIQPELMGSMMGANYGDATVTYRETLLFFEVPVLLKLRLKVGKLALHPYIGPDFLFQFGEWMLSVKDDVSGSVLMSGTNTAKTRVPLIGAVAGLGLQFPVVGRDVFLPAGRGVLTLDVRYHLGLMSLVEETVSFGPAAAPDVKQNNVQVLIGYGFRVVE